MVWLFSGVCRSKARLDGKRAVVTGANTGIGKETALELAARGCRVVLAVRDTAKGERAAADIRKKLSAQRRAGVPVGEVSVEHLDLASLKSVRACALRLLNDEHKAIHILVNNAGVMACPKAYTEDGHDLQFGVNHLGHFLLTALLLPRIRASVGPAPAGPTPAGPTPAGPTPAGPTPAGPAPAGPAPAGPAPAGPAPAGPTPAEPAPAEQGAAADGHPEPHPDPARIITVSSAAYAFSRIDFDDLRYERGYRPLFAYGRSKLANMLFTRELARRLKGKATKTIPTSLPPSAMDSRGKQL
ncbi:Retinol dehydrogenase 13 [Frankliniella fusca]|uniref:Retinol dehydrogenase 13 n=1 Tax=Frankliniella fusca TaxID=407009 RepID=A0AAE1LN07_9NEOP|nr:Retinol dehydrogenase 13 [Frankliniella fusca]